MPNEPTDPETPFQTPEEKDGRLEDIAVEESRSQRAEVPFETPSEEEGRLEDFGINRQKMAEDWERDVRNYIRYTTMFTMGVIGAALALDFYQVIWEVASDPDDRLLNTEVLLALIAASVAQIGALAYLIGSSIFQGKIKDRN